MPLETADNFRREADALMFYAVETYGTIEYTPKDLTPILDYWRELRSEKGTDFPLCGTH